MCPYPVIFLDGAAADLVYLRIAGVYGLLQFISWKLDNFNGLQVLDYPSVLGTGERSVVYIRTDVSSVNGRQNMVLYTLIVIGRLLFNCSPEGGLLCVERS